MATVLPLQFITLLFIVCILFSCVSSAQIVTPSPNGTDWRFRLTGSSSLFYGRVEVLPPGKSQWGTVCSDNIKTSLALRQMLCRQIGFANATTADFEFFPSLSPTIAPDNQPIWLGGLVCPLGATSVMSQCTFDPLGATTCTHADDTALRCEPDPSTWEFRFQNGTGTQNQPVVLWAFPTCETRPWRLLWSMAFQAGQTIFIL